MIAQPPSNPSRHPLVQRARRAGIEPERPNAQGGLEPVGRAAIEHLLDVLGPRQPHRTPATGRCHVPAGLQDRKAWGISLQLYELRSHRNWGIGDFADLARMCELAADAGADFIGLNPLHALFTADPGRRSPFAPCSRLFLNPLYIAVDLVDPDAGAACAADLEQLRCEDFVDYGRVARVKMDALRAIHRRLPEGTGLEDFRRQGGAALRRHGIFEALSHAMVAQGHGAGWTDWPEPLRRGDGEAVEAFARDHADEVAFHVWLQWQADRQLGAAATRAREAGMRIGLYLDLAVGEAPDGSAVWSDPDAYLRRTTIGAPPDMFTHEGQDWGLAPLSPGRLEETGARAVEDLARALMRHAGALRIDHAMALQHLFLVPEGRSPRDGAYVEYPTGLMIDAIARASRERGSVVIGEDLGVVPEGFRDTMEGANIFSYRPLYFEQDEAGFRPPRAYPELSLSCLSTHDLPTLVGWWEGRDVELRVTHGLIDPSQAQAHRETRALERRMLAKLLGLGGVEGSPAELAVAAHRFLAATGSLLSAVRLADMVGEGDPTNLPGTSDSYPNWARRLRPDIEELAQTDLWRAIVEGMTHRPPATAARTTAPGG